MSKGIAGRFVRTGIASIQSGGNGYCEQHGSGRRGAGGSSVEIVSEAVAKEIDKHLSIILFGSYKNAGEII